VGQWGGAGGACCEDHLAFCGELVGLVEFENRGVSGSTAREWQEAEGCGGTACSPAAAFDTGEYTHAWVSIGGNDYLQNDCRPPEDLRNVIDTAFEDIAAAAGPGVKILTTGYGAVSTDDEVCTPADTASGNAIIRTASEAMGWTHVDVLESLLCGNQPVRQVHAIEQASRR
jgi:hypothetical protein